MKYLIILCVLSLVGWTIAGTSLHPRGCIYVSGQCVRQCEVGTHAYSIACGALTPEPSCDNPNPKPDDRGLICDFSACYCDRPTVRDRVTKKCVQLADCSK